MKQSQHRQNYVYHCKLEHINSEDYIEFVKDRCYNDRRYFISDEKLRQLGWKPKIDWEEGLKETYKWYRNVDLSAYWNENKIIEALKAHPVIKSDTSLPVI